MRASANDEKVSKRFLFQKEFEEVLIGEGGQEMVVEEQRTPWMGDQKEACTLPRLSVCSHVVLITRKNVIEIPCSLLGKPHEGRDHIGPVQCCILSAPQDPDT